jgi:hypothetical protein
MTPCLTQGILVKDGVINEQSCDSLLKTFFKKSASFKNILEYSIIKTRHLSLQVCPYQHV